MSENLAARGTPFFCAVCDCLGKAGFTNEGAEIQVRLMEDGEIRITYTGDQSAVEMPNWPYYAGSARITIAGGDCPGAPTH